MAREGMKALAERAQRASTQLKRVREKAEEKMEVAIDAVVTVGGAGGLAVLRGYLNETGSDEDPLAIGGVPGDLIAGLAFHAAASFGAFGKYDRFGHAAGNACLASYAVVKGLDLGAEMAAEGSSTRGLPGGVNPAGLYPHHSQVAPPAVAAPAQAPPAPPAE